MKAKSFFKSLAVLSMCVAFNSVSLHAGPPQKQSSKKPDTPATSSNNAAPKSGCDLLPVSLLEKTLGEKFDEPSEAKAPPAYDGAWGSSCQYSSQPPFTKGHQIKVDFLVYVEASSPEAKQTFDKAAVFFKDNSKPPLTGIGDSAYWNTTHNQNAPVIHILKGKIHCQLELDPANEKQVKDVAAALAAHL